MSTQAHSSTHCLLRQTDPTGKEKSFAWKYLITLFFFRLLLPKKEGTQPFRADFWKHTQTPVAMLSPWGRGTLLAKFQRALAC